MARVDIGANQQAAPSRLGHRISLIAVTCAVLVIAGTTACRRDASSAKSNGPQPGKVAQVEPQRTQAQDEQSCKEFVQEFYDWYVVRSAADQESRTAGPAGSTVLRSRPKVLSPELAQRLREDNEAQAKAHELVGLDFDPFFNSQDPSPKFVVESAIFKDKRCDAVVIGFRERTKQERVMPELALAGTNWFFVNFHYGKAGNIQDYNLSGVLKDLADQRKKHRN